jgi:hypothetical protein
MHEYHNVIDRDNDEGVAWGPGPWDGEPDKVEWLDEATGLPCLAVRGNVGSWCGYVGVPPGHPDYEKPYPEIDEHYECHGGLTFSDHCQEGPIERTVCHTAEGQDRVWWLGFDTIHYNDMAPKMEAFYRRLREEIDHPLFRRTYKTLGYVRAEVANLARQVAEREVPR